MVKFMALPMKASIYLRREINKLSLTNSPTCFNNSFEMANNLVHAKPCRPTLQINIVLSIHRPDYRRNRAREIIGSIAADRFLAGSLRFTFATGSLKEAASFPRDTSSLFFFLLHSTLLNDAHNGTELGVRQISRVSRLIIPLHPPLLKSCPIRRQ